MTTTRSINQSITHLPKRRDGWMDDLQMCVCACAYVISGHPSVHPSVLSVCLSKHTFSPRKRPSVCLSDLSTNLVLPGGGGSKKCLAFGLKQATFHHHHHHQQQQHPPFRCFIMERINRDLDLLSTKMPLRSFLPTISPTLPSLTYRAD